MKIQFENNLEYQNNNLLDKAISIINNGRKKVIEAIYNESTKSYYKLGELIVKDEQQGKYKAQYGKKVIENLSKNLTLKYGRGFSVSTLWDCKKFYIKLQSLTGEFNFRLSFTHYTYLIRLDDEEFKFYEKYAIEQNLSVRELQKAVQDNTMYRVGNTQKRLEITPSKPKDIIKDPYILDFLGLDEINQGDEKLLENKLIEHLEKFLLELGRGFAFVKRQYRLTLSEDNFYADLVFYNIPLKCYVVIELKTRKLKHQDLGQLQMYVNYFDQEVKNEDDNPTIGILLCSDKNDNVVKYTLPKDNEHIFASKYKLYLPSLEELKNELEIIDENTI
jgi:predicted nuclease of restriction endonuclease-like (RecB) superfamily